MLLQLPSSSSSQKIDELRFILGLLTCCKYLTDTITITGKTDLCSFQMSKRKIECNVNDFVAEYLKKAKFKKTLDLFDKQNHESKKSSENMNVQFVQYLKAQTMQNKNEDDLGFEVNFGAYQPEAKLKILKTKKRSKNQTKKSDEKEKRIDVPFEFIEKIKKLGMEESEAGILYKTRINWTEVYSENKIYCTEQHCDFYTKIDNDELTKHMITVHSYGENPCTHPGCNFVGISKKNLNLHARMHTMQSDKQFWYKCPKTTCSSSFESENKLKRHMRIHNNDLTKCQYCPFRYVQSNQYTNHLRTHFGIMDYKCDQCDKAFASNGELNKHYAVHEGIIFCCSICKLFKTTSKASITRHFRQKHAEKTGINIFWQDVQKFIERI